MILPQRLSNHPSHQVTTDICYSGGIWRSGFIYLIPRIGSLRPRKNRPLLRMRFEQNNLPESPGRKRTYRRYSYRLRTRRSLRKKALSRFPVRGRCGELNVLNACAVAKYNLFGTGLLFSRYELALYLLWEILRFLSLCQWRVVGISCDAKFLHFGQQSSALEAQPDRRAMRSPDDRAGFLQSLQDSLALHIFKRARHSRQDWIGLLQIIGSNLQNVSWSQYHGSLN